MTKPIKPAYLFEIRKGRVSNEYYFRVVEPRTKKIIFSGKGYNRKDTIYKTQNHFRKALERGAVKYLDFTIKLK